MNRNAPTRTPPLETLACPACRSPLEENAEGLTCISCRTPWPAREGYVDFLAPPSDPAGLRGWQRRQAEMGDWYDDLLSAPAAAADCYLNDYEPLSDELGRLSGRVLDVGGGAGITRHNLTRDVDYFNVDPSTEWLGREWLAIAKTFPALAEPMLFVCGRGEQLPFRAESFEATLALWSLNHVSSPELVVRECGRVLKPGGCLFVVLEDMEPRRGDISGWPLRLAARMALEKVARRLMNRPWPIQSDHIAIDERDVLGWTRGSFVLERRAWTPGGSPGYLSLRLRKR